MFEEGARIVRRDVPITVEIVFNRNVASVNAMLKKTPVEKIPRGSTLEALQNIYAHNNKILGASRKSVSAETAMDHEPGLVVPFLSHTRYYPLLCIQALTLEAIVREYEPAFSMELALETLCQESDYAIDLAFPVRHALDKILLQTMPVEGDRLIPVCSFPFVLSCLPDCYQRAANTLKECESLSLTLYQKVDKEHLDRPHVPSQIAKLSRNRNHLAFLQQQAYQFFRVPLVKRQPDYEQLYTKMQQIVENQERELKSLNKRQKRTAIKD